MSKALKPQHVRITPLCVKEIRDFLATLKFPLTFPSAVEFLIREGLQRMKERENRKDS